MEATVRILLVNTNRERRPYPVIPIGLACVARALEGAGHEVGVADLTFARDPHGDLARAAARTNPELIGLSIRNLDNSSYAQPKSYLDELRALAQTCRRVSRAPLAIGGPAAGVAGDALLRDLDADYAVLGEGESVALALAGAVQAGTRPPQLPGLVVAGERVAAAPRPGLDAPPSLGALPRYVDVRRYLRSGAPLPIQARRGCAFHCAYCTYPALEGTSYRLKDPDEVAAEVEELRAATGSRCFEFVDSTFNTPQPYTVEVCEALARLRPGLHFEASGFTPAQSSPELLAAMRAAGYRTLVSSPDSASDQVLEAMGKGFWRADLERLVEHSRRAGFVAMWSFLFGGPGETEGTARETLRFIARRLGGRDLVFVAAGVRIYPGTPLERLSRDEGLLGAEDDLLDLRFYLSPRLPLGRLGALFEEYLAGARNCVFISDLQCSLVPLLERGMAALGVPPPLWRFVPHMRRLVPHRSPMLPGSPIPLTCRGRSDSRGRAR